MKTILQTEAAECGLACLAMIASYHGNHVDLPALRRRFSFSVNGATLVQLIRHASALHMTARAVRVELSEIGNLRLPCIAHWNMNHFVVIKAISTGITGNIKVTIIDPALGERILSLEQMSRQFTGVALELSPTPEFEQTKAAPRISIRALTGTIIGLRRALIQIFFLALALEVFSLIAPLFNQFVIDEAIVSGDMELMTVLVIGFALLLVIRTMIDLARSFFLMRWSIDVGLQWSSRVFSHLTRLPIVFFEKRHLGDIVSRFGSIDSIQSTLTTLFVETALDGLMALLALSMMMFYSPLLTAVVLVTVFAYGTCRWLFYAPLREASKERLVLDARQSSNFLETVRAITPIKLFGREAERRANWQNLKLDVANRDIKTQKLTLAFRVLTTAITGAQGLIVFYLGANLVIEKALTVGMLMAFTSYAGTFSSRVFSLIDALISLKMLGLHSERLSDIVLEHTESVQLIESDDEQVAPSITLRNVKFRYGDGEPWILNGINLEIPAMQSVALVGPSGGGKTTLSKILIGFLEPTEGEVLVGGVPLKKLGLQNYRRMVGTVMQNDVLLAGSIFENISFFDVHADKELIEKCARMACIHDDILAMPMQYQTIVGDLGSSLSGGQKQRVLLARALYKRPSILALDEATSHLDIPTERKLNKTLSELSVTRVMVAHRPEAIRSAQRVILVAEGMIREESSIEHLSAAAAQGYQRVSTRPITA
ncbi:peptidase domain-containing ABC transporter [Undibacterium sp.]|jgi:ATP-binding cassette subfamily B protein RaxB|uniref:peptidase domain-containing ABC transporter n=1 Tax=Undibacterium sp. TaxID=1914977 RepID=UPI002D180DB2|nr:peptidase domain-containing ABC transporter [Undibacterium sp.]HTD05218.1 peptidase domain-containing ABC transporter [Undibacterium sp.]